MNQVSVTDTAIVDCTLTAMNQDGSAVGNVSQKPRRTLRDEQKLMTRQKLVAATRKLFAEKGYGATTIDDIAEAAGASRGTYYLYFKNKGEIVTELAEEYTAATEALLPELAQQADPSRAHLRNWLQKYVDLVLTHQVTIRASMQAEGGAPEMRAANDQRVTRFRDLLAGWLTGVRRQQGLSAEPEAIRIRTTAMLLQLERFCYFWLIRGWPIDDSTAIDVLADIWYTTVHSDEGRAGEADDEAKLT
jgi:AcrR family transcriptional regulator